MGEELINVGPSLQEETERRLIGQAEFWKDRAESAQEDVAYWRGNYEILRRVIAEQHDDPAFNWLDELVRTKFGMLR